MKRLATDLATASNVDDDDNNDDDAAAAALDGRGRTRVMFLAVLQQRRKQRLIGTQFLLYLSRPTVELRSSTL